MKGKGLYIILALAAAAAFYFLYWKKRHFMGRPMMGRPMPPPAAKKKRGWRSKLGGFAKNLSQPLVTGALAGVPGGSAILGAAAESGLL
jgi:hypothetical protein